WSWLRRIVAGDYSKKGQGPGAAGGNRGEPERLAKFERLIVLPVAADASPNLRPSTLDQIIRDPPTHVATTGPALSRIAPSTSSTPASTCTAVKSAQYPGPIAPILPAIPSARAARTVPISSRLRAGTSENNRRRKRSSSRMD